MGPHAGGGSDHRRGSGHPGAVQWLLDPGHEGQDLRLLGFGTRPDRWRVLVMVAAPTPATMRRQRDVGRPGLDPGT